MNNCYVYEIIVSGVVRYIGKGSGRRVFAHAREAKRVLRERQNGAAPRASRFYLMLADAIQSEEVIAHRIVVPGLSESQAFHEETRLIDSCEKGQLWNELPGGRGFSYSKIGDQEAFKRKVKEGVRRSWDTDKRRRERASAGATRRWQNQDKRDEHSSRLKEVWAEPRLRERHAAEVRGRFVSEEDWSSRQSAIAKRRWSNPEARNAQSRRARSMQAERSARKNAAISCGILSFGC